MRRWRRSTAALAATLLAVGLSVGIAEPPPAGAILIETRAGDLPPAMWVDGEGRQYIVGILADANNEMQMFVSRSLATDEPDAAWGTFEGRVGVHAVDFDPPAGDIYDASVVSATDAGIITLVWRSPGCTAPVCTRTFARYEADGTSAGAPVTVDDVPTIIQALPDGSFATKSASGAFGGRGNDGADRGAPAIQVDDTSSISLDHTGRLLLATKAHDVIRWPSGGPAAAAVPVDCGGTVVAGATQDDGFATACSDGVATALEVERHAADGSVSWSTSGSYTPAGSTPTWPIERVDHVFVDGSDHAWVSGGSGTHGGNNGTNLIRQSLAAFDSGGPLPLGAMLPATDRQGAFSYGGGLSDIRAVDDHHIAYAAIDECCSSMGGFVEDSVDGSVLPERPGPPHGAATIQSVESVDDSSIDVRFTPDRLEGAGREPSGYRVTAISTAGTQSTTTVTPVGDDLTAHLDGLTGGRLTTVYATPFNSYGDTTAGPAYLKQYTSVRTVLPFASIEAFVNRQHHDLIGGPGNGPIEPPALIAAGTLDPLDHVASLLDTGLAKTDVEPVARLYRAEFLRDPDFAGLTYWVRTHHTGTTLSSIATQFAASHEFTRRYGLLSNGDFVAKLYQNVFGRSGDPAGLAFWTKRLDHHTNTRGQVVLQFSQASEGLRRSAPIVQPLATSFLLLGRRPTASERAASMSLPHPHHDVAAAILATHEYAVHVGAA